MMRSRGPSLTIVMLAVLGLLLTPVVVWASHQFRDVPDDHVFHEDIGWLADNQVTLGCNPPDNDLFCPDEGVTRGQMAAFMRRLSEGGVVDASTVGGLSPGNLGGAFSVAAPLKHIPSQESVSVVTSNVDMPAAGTLTLTGEMFFYIGWEHVGAIWTEVDDGSCDIDKNRPESSITTYGTHRSQLLFGNGGGAATWVLPVGRGRHRVDLCFYTDTNTGDSQVGDYNGGITGIWGPGNISTTQETISEVTVSELLAEHG
ncbi:MAG: hypothetical protein GEU79_11120 [Acidimicrobiia bacterium]|nr:hypothetical protein [Acidimicrobiia bacterium]